MQTSYTLRCIQSGEKCSFISLLAPYSANKYKFLIKIMSSSVKVILFIYLQLSSAKVPGCNGNLAAGTRPVLNFSSSINLQLNGGALCEKSLWANFFGWKLTYHGHTTRKYGMGVAWKKRWCKEQCQVHAGEEKQLLTYLITYLLTYLLTYYRV